MCNPLSGGSGAQGGGRPLPPLLTRGSEDAPKSWHSRPQPSSKPHPLSDACHCSPVAPSAGVGGSPVPSLPTRGPAGPPKTAAPPRSRSPLDPQLAPCPCTPGPFPGGVWDGVGVPQSCPLHSGFYSPPKNLEPPILSPPPATVPAPPQVGIGVCGWAGGSQTSPLSLRLYSPPKAPAPPPHASPSPLDPPTSPLTSPPPPTPSPPSFSRRLLGGLQHLQFLG